MLWWHANGCTFCRYFHVTPGDECISVSNALNSDTSFEFVCESGAGNELYLGAHDQADCTDNSLGVNSVVPGAAHEATCDIRNDDTHYQRVLCRGDRDCAAKKVSCEQYATALNEMLPPPAATVVCVNNYKVRGTAIAAHTGRTDETLDECECKAKCRRNVACAGYVFKQDTLCELWTSGQELVGSHGYKYCAVTVTRATSSILVDYIVSEGAVANYDEAKQYCKDNDSVIAMPKSEAENNAAFDVCKMAAPSDQKCFLGLELDTRQDIWKWADGTTVGWDAWGPNQGCASNIYETRGFYHGSQDGKKWHHVNPAGYPVGGDEEYALCQVVKATALAVHAYKPTHQYERLPKTCVVGRNIKKYADKSIPEVNPHLCNMRPLKQLTCIVMRPK